MPPRFAYWTIILEGKPTAFRAQHRDELVPTMKQLQARHPDVVMKWFARGRLWSSPEEAQASRRAGTHEGRGPAWRPGGEHRDPRDRFKIPRDVKRRRFAAKLRERREEDLHRSGARPSGRDSGPPRSSFKQHDKRTHGTPFEKGSGRAHGRPLERTKRSHRRAPFERNSDRARSRPEWRRERDQRPASHRAKHPPGGDADQRPNRRPRTRPEQRDASKSEREGREERRPRPPARPPGGRKPGGGGRRGSGGGGGQDR